MNNKDYKKMLSLSENGISRRTIILIILEMSKDKSEAANRIEQFISERLISEEDEMNDRIKTMKEETSGSASYAATRLK